MALIGICIECVCAPVTLGKAWTHNIEWHLFWFLQCNCCYNMSYMFPVEPLLNVEGSSVARRMDIGASDFNLRHTLLIVWQITPLLRFSSSSNWIQKHATGQILQHNTNHLLDSEGVATCRPVLNLRIIEMMRYIYRPSWNDCKTFISNLPGIILAWLLAAMDQCPW